MGYQPTPKTLFLVVTAACPKSITGYQPTLKTLFLIVTAANDIDTAFGFALVPARLVAHLQDSSLFALL
jgi:hypothetical protein